MKKDSEKFKDQSWAIWSQSLVSAKDWSSETTRCLLNGT